MIRFGLPLVLFMVWVGVADHEPARVARPDPQESLIDYSRDIAPILANKCFQCHGSDESTRKAKLRLDSAEHATQILRNGTAAIKPGRPNESELVRRIRSRDADEVMPPAGSKKPLSEDEKKWLERWIEQGAVYKRHWAFTPGVNPRTATRRWWSGSPASPSRLVVSPDQQNATRRACFGTVVARQRRSTHCCRQPDVR